MSDVKPCACCGKPFRPAHKESRLCSQSCVNRARRRPTLQERFLRRVEQRGPDECWPWLGPLRRRGYGQMKWTDGRYHAAHRIAWEIANGTPVPDGLHACHSCDNPTCCNPSHIWPGTATENVHDRDAKGRTSQGMEHYAAKLTADQVRAIRASSDSHSALARFYGVAISHVANIRKGTKWRSVA